MSKEHLDVDIDTSSSDDLKKCFLTLFNVLNNADNEANYDKAYRLLGSIMFGLVQNERITFHIAEPVKKD